MAGEVTVDSFLDLLGQSDLVSDAQLLALTAEFLSEGNRPASPQELADELVKREVLTTWQADMLMQRKHRGFRLGPYRILRPLGQGGMSKVFLADHEMMHRRSAIKVLPSKYQEDADLLNRFHLEARAVAALDHPNIVRAYDFNKDVRYGKEIHYLVMEYVEGSDLRRMVEEQGPLDYRKAADFVCQAALGLAHAHAAGFVHRDIKPANLLVDPHGVLKILDLGLATFTFEAEQTLNPTEGVQSAVGTADYVSPEQVIDSRNVDGRADIYSLGLTFYYLLTGHRPFSKPTIMEVLMAHRAEKPEPISKSRPDVPLDLEAIVDKMAAKSPQQRYQTAKEVAEKLQKWQAESGSARTYSRLSALMAEAARTKQSSGSGALPTVSGPAANSELELVTVDDEATSSRDTTAATTTAKDPTENDNLTMAETKEKNHRPVAKGSVLPQAKKLPEEQAESKGDKTSPPDIQNIQTDLLSGLFAEDLMSALPPAEPLSGLAVGQGPLQQVAPSSAKKQTDVGKLMKSPWPWVGLAVGVVLVCVLIFVMMSGSSSTSVPSGNSGSAAVAPAADASPAAPPPAPAPQAPSPKPVEPSTAPPPQAEAVPSPAAVPVPVQPVVEKAPPAAKPAEAAPPAATVEEKTPPAAAPTPAANEVKQPEPATPPPEKEKATNNDELLAGIKTISVRLGKSINPNPKAMLNQAIMVQAKGAARQVGLEFAEKSPNVMEVDLTVTNENDVFRVVLSAELTGPGADGKDVTLWKKSAPMLSGDPKKMNPAQVVRVLTANAGKFADKFFEQFSTDLKQARAKVGAK
jgi:eukaryotic-like serine/threonine-protein kinase